MKQNQLRASSCCSRRANYIDSFREARKVLVEQVAGSLFTIAKDVKIQIEFNPAEVQSYRLIEEIASSALGKDPRGYRAEFVSLVRKAAQLRR